MYNDYLNDTFAFQIPKQMRNLIYETNKHFMHGYQWIFRVDEKQFLRSLLKSLPHALVYGGSIAHRPYSDR